MFESIPQELKFDALWCCWKKNENGKVPYDVVKGTFAKSNDRTTFYNFKTILNKLHYYLKCDDKGVFLGGIGLGIFNGFSAIDIDNCIDENGVVSEIAQEIIDYCQSYTEKSPSGKGIRIIFKTDFKDFDKKIYYTNNRKIGLEIYVEGVTNKFVTITGNTILSCNVANVDISYILNKYMRKKVTTPKEQGVNVYNIESFLNKDKKLNELWNSTASGSGGNESETDLALCGKLAFYLQRNYEAIEAAFESSPYFNTKDDKHRKKWLERTDYRESTINMAIETCSEVYSPSKIYKKNYSLNDTGNAHRFVDKYGTEVHYNVDNKAWMVWNGQFWQFDYFNNIKNLAEILIEEMKLESFKIEDIDRQKEALKNVNRLFNSNGKELMLKEAQHLTDIPVSNDMFDKDDMLFNCKNGVINLKTGELLPHNKNLLLSKISDVEYDTKQVPHRFLKFLDDIFEGNKDIINYVQKAFGYAMTGSTIEQKMFIFNGDGANGKSLLLQIINEVIQDYAATSNVDLLLDKKTQSANMSEVARLKGIRMVVTNETKLGDKLNENVVKDITGGNNKITARFLYANEFEFYPKMKIFMLTNYMPIIHGTDNGIWRRIVKVPFTRIFDEKEQDKFLIEKLREEKSGILNWLVVGCLLWQREGLFEPEILREEKKEYRTEMDLVQKWLDECCEVDKSYVEKAADLFENFKAYCIKYDEFKMSQTLFGRNFGKKFTKTRLGGTTVYKGVRLKNDI